MTRVTRSKKRLTRVKKGQRPGTVARGRIAHSTDTSTPVLHCPEEYDSHGTNDPHEYGSLWYHGVIAWY
eukprot:3938921-Rhodomonas_salina.1